MQKHYIRLRRSLWWSSLSSYDTSDDYFSALLTLIWICFLKIKIRITLHIYAHASHLISAFLNRHHMYEQHFMNKHHVCVCARKRNNNNHTNLMSLLHDFSWCMINKVQVRLHKNSFQFLISREEWWNMCHYEDFTIFTVITYISTF